jgi:hypothetical protein
MTRYFHVTSVRNRASIAAHEFIRRDLDGR